MKKSLVSLLFAGVLFSCKDDRPKEELPEFKDRSKSEALAGVSSDFSNVKLYTLISSDDSIQASPGFVYGGAPDGQGFLKNPDGSGYIMVTNHENAFSVSRVYLDKKLNPIKGEYLLDTDGGLYRLCSGSLATTEHGFANPIYLSTGESNLNAMTHAIDPISAANPKDASRVKPALGKFSGENSVPLTQQAYPGKTVIILGEDATNGQVYLYVSDTKADLENGKLYALRRTNLDQIETSMKTGSTYDVEFVQVPNAKSLTGPEIDGLNTTLKSIQFARVEDLDYRKGSASSNREIYFTATGVAGKPEKTYWGRVYRLKLKEGNPLAGTLEIIADGDSNPGKDIINPDNLCVTENYVYIQEDGDSFFPGAAHNSLIWQYNIAKSTKKQMIELKNQVLAGSKFNPGGNMKYGLWEYGAMIDISDIVGVPGTFTLNLHAHGWVEGQKFANPSKATSGQPYSAGGQTVILTNVPR